MESAKTQMSRKPSRASDTVTMSTTTTVRTKCALDACMACGLYTVQLDQLGAMCSDVRITSLVVEVELDSNGVLTMSPTTNPEVKGGAWCEYACAARDRHEQNMEVFMDETAQGDDGVVTVRTTRPVACGEQLFVWFEESLARQRNIPILTPANIRGKDEYLCTSCGAAFEHPNPLKSHIRYHCSMKDVHLASTSNSSSPWISSNLPLLMPSPWLSPWIPRVPTFWGASLLTSLAARTSHAANRNPGLPMSYADDVIGSARNAGTWWLDYVHLLHVASSNNMYSARTAKVRDATSDVDKLTSEVTTSSSRVAASRRAAAMNEQTMTQSQLLPVASKVAAKSRGGGTGAGYACPYCGKLYSRRYGLKIHVRTHTGFKPLQCAVCRRPFGDPSNLNKHIRLHAQSAAPNSAAPSSVDAPYRCRHCGKVLVRRRDLERHVRARHADQLTDDVSNTAGANTVIVASSECVSADDDDDDDVIVNSHNGQLLVESDVIRPT